MQLAYVRAMYGSHVICVLCYVGSIWLSHIYLTSLWPICCIVRRVRQPTIHSQQQYPFKSRNAGLTSDRRFSLKLAAGVVSIIGSVSGGDATNAHEVRKQVVEQFKGDNTPMVHI